MQDMNFCLYLKKLTIMKRIVFAVLSLLAGVCAGAQGQKQLDSLKYILPEFGQGTVIFADKQFNRGVLNISPLDQSVYCLSPEKDTLYVSGNPDIISVSVAGRSFVKWKDSFVEVITRDPDTGIGVIRSVVKVNNVKTGAYGMSSSTASIKSYSVDANTGILTNLIIDDPRNYVYTRTACLMSKGKYYPVSKKSFEKVFPDKKDYIESVWSELSLSSTDVEAVLAFYNSLLHPCQ